MNQRIFIYQINYKDYFKTDHQMSLFTHIYLFAVETMDCDLITNLFSTLQQGKKPACSTCGHILLAYT